MRIVLMSDTFFPQINGVARTVYQSAKTLAELGHSVLVVAPVSLQDERRAKEGNYEFIRHPSFPALVYPGLRIAWPISFRVFKRIKEFNPDIIHAHTPFTVGLFSILAAKLTGAKRIATSHTFFEHYLHCLRLNFSVFQKISRLYTIWFCNRFHFVISPSLTMSTFLAEFGLKRRVHLCPNFIDAAEFSPASEAEKAESKKSLGLFGKVVVYMGRLSREKYVHQVVLAFEKCAKTDGQMSLLVIGDGPERKNLEALTHKRNISDRVVFTGFLEGAALAAALRAGDVFTTASKSENMPLSVLEAMAVGLPVIAPAENGLRELVKENENGFLFPADNIEELSTLIKRILTDGGERLKMGRASRRMAEGYGHAGVSAALEGIYRSQLNDGTKIFLYLEGLHFLNGLLYQSVGTGLLSSYKNQKKILSRLGIFFSESSDADCTIIQLNTPWLFSLWKARRAKKAGQKVIMWAHITAEDIRGVFRFSPALSFFARKYLAYAYAKADIICTPSEYTKSLLIRYGLPSDKIFAISNGVDTEVFTADLQKRKTWRRKNNISEDSVVVGTVGLAVRRKGIDTFLSLARGFPSNRFFWFGKIYSRLLAPALPERLPPNVSFTGYVDDIIAAQSAIDIFVFPSYEENEGMAVLEAASFGLPILVRDIPVYKGWLLHEENCLLAKDDREFELNLKRLIENPALRERLGREARKLAESRNLSEIGKKMSEIYGSLQLR